MSWKKIEGISTYYQQAEPTYRPLWDGYAETVRVVSPAAVGDLAIVVFTTYMYARTVATPPSGWTEILDETSNYLKTVVYWKILEEDDIGAYVEMEWSGVATGNASLAVYRYRENATVSLVDWAIRSSDGITSTIPYTPPIDVTNDRQLVVYIITQNDVVAPYTPYIEDGEGPYPDDVDSDKQMNFNYYVSDDPFTALSDYFTINDGTSPSVSGTYYCWQAQSGNGDQHHVIGLVFEHSDSEGADPTMGYGHNVFGVDSGDISSVFGVDTGDINSVFGVE